MLEPLPQTEYYLPVDPRVIANPYPFYTKMRLEAPVYWSALLKSWMVTRYDHVAAVIKNDEQFAGGAARVDSIFASFRPENQQKLSFFIEKLKLWTLFMDPPKHTRMRESLNKLFFKFGPKELLPHIEAITTELLKEAQEKREVDFIRDIAYPLPVLVIARLLGMPDSDREHLKRWADDLANFLARLKRPFEIADQGQNSLAEMSEYVRALVRRKRVGTDKDFVSELSQDPTLTEEEVIATIVMMVFAGHETTTNLLGNGYLALLQNPEVMADLRKQPEILGLTIEEMLRYDSPVQFLARVATSDVMFGGQKIEKGQRLLNFLGSANRDAGAFPDPDVFNPVRNPNKHLSFGSGIHFCTGAGLARLEAKILFTAMLNKFPRWEWVDQTLNYREDLGFRGLHHLKTILK